MVGGSGCGQEGEDSAEPRAGGQPHRGARAAYFSTACFFLWVDREGGWPRRAALHWLYYIDVCIVRFDVRPVGAIDCDVPGWVMHVRG